MGRAVKGALAEVGVKRRLTADDIKAMDFGPFNFRAEARERCDLRPGDVVLTLGSDGRPVEALVLLTHVTHSDHSLEYHVKFKVRCRKNNGGWSALWEYTYPGFIERAFAGDLAD